MTVRRRRGFTLVELLVVIGIIALLIAILMPALSRARKQALQVSCGSNERQVTYAMLSYANDWKEQLPTRSGYALNTRSSPSYIGHYPSGVSPTILNFMTRLPIIGFDTTTVWDWGTYDDPTMDSWSASQGGGVGEVHLGGAAFVFRDYLKNDFDIYVCPDGWFTRANMIGKWNGCTGTGLRGPACICGGTNNFDCDSALTTYRTGYLWLPHRANTVCVFSPCQARFCDAGPMTDQPGSVAKTASAKADLLVLTDFNLFDYSSVGDCPSPPAPPPDSTKCGVASNHSATDYKQLPVFGSNCLPRISIPGVTRDMIPEQMPLGMNKARIDARTTWQPFQDWDFFRWCDYTVWHSF